MAEGKLPDTRLGWVGTGRMGYRLASRLLEAGCDLAVYNRTRSKAEPLAEHGATIVDSPAELADREIVQSLAEILVLAEKDGIARADLLEFLNKSVMGSMFTRYKTPAYVKLDFTPTFTPLLLRKDFDLGFEAARRLDVPMPVAAAALQTVQTMIGHGHTDDDFAALIEVQAQASGYEIEPEDAEVTDGLGPAAEAPEEVPAASSR